MLMTKYARKTFFSTNSGFVACATEPVKKLAPSLFG